MRYSELDIMTEHQQPGLMLIDPEVFAALKSTAAVSTPLHRDRTLA
jgi:hypothetical protein